MKPPKNIVVTGVTGFVGENLTKYLGHDYSITGVSRNKTTDKKTISYKELSKRFLNETNAFIHLAGKAHDLKKVSDDSEYFEVNTELTKKLFDLFLESNCEVFVYMSSVKAVADSLDDVLTENFVSNPKTVYGRSKIAAEEYILSHKNIGKKKIFILRPCMIHGPGNKGNLNLLYSIISKGIPYPLGSYQNQRSFLTIENLCFVIKELITGDVKSGVYNVSDDKAISTTDLVKIIGVGIGRKAKIISIPKLIINLIAKLGNILSLPLNTERLDKLTENYVVSNSKIKKAIKKDFPMSSKEGLEKTIKSFIND